MKHQHIFIFLVVSNLILMILNLQRHNMILEEEWQTFQVPSTFFDKLNLNHTAQPLTHFLPHLSKNSSYFQPAFVVSSTGRSNVSIVIGVPTVKRDVQNYLMETLRSLIDNMSEKESNDCLIVVFVGETDLYYVKNVSQQIIDQFPRQVESGLIEVISPLPIYYPDFNTIRQTLGNTIDRAKWRSKQNLDYAFLMMYSQPKGRFYVQLEDDIITKRHFFTTMKTFALDASKKDMPWSALSFSHIGFIGKLFKSEEIHLLAQFFSMFFNEKPVDWLLQDYLTVKVCNLEYDDDQCNKAKAQHWINFIPSQFQQIGLYSSLKGKIQKLKDQNFGNVELLYSHRNPRAVAQSDVTSVIKKKTLQLAYEGKTFFWGKAPRANDRLTFTFNNPVLIERFLFRSGYAFKFVNTTVEVLPVKQNINYTIDKYIVVGQFDSLGLAVGTVTGLGKIKVLRLHVQTTMKTPVLLNEILIEADDKETGDFYLKKSNP